MAKFQTDFDELKDDIYHPYNMYCTHQGKRHTVADIPDLINKIESVELHNETLVSANQDLMSDNVKLKGEILELKERIRALKTPRVPTHAASSKLAEILERNVGGGDIQVVYTETIDKKYIDKLTARIDQLENWAFGKNNV